MSEKSKETREKILLGARSAFAEKGFAGASMSYIAKQAGVTQSLISHHFNSKPDLWKEVKHSFLNDSDLLTEPVPTDSLESCIEHIVRVRTKMFDENRELARMIYWQRLEEHQEDLVGGNSGTPTRWIEPLTTLQEKSLIRAGLRIDLVVVFIASAISGTQLPTHPPFKDDPQAKSEYIEMLIDNIVGWLKT